MDVTQIAAVAVAAILFFVAAFQLALAAGAPWGHAAYGAHHPDRLPLAWRVNSLVAAVALPILGLALLDHGGFAVWSPLPEQWGQVFVWILVVFFALQAVLNVLSPSKWERYLWSPLSAVAVAGLLVVALTA